MAVVHLGTAGKGERPEVSSKDAALGKGAVLPMRLESADPSRLAHISAQGSLTTDASLTVNGASSTVTSPNTSGSSIDKSFTLVERLQDPAWQISIKHSVLAIFKDGARAVTREEYREATTLREELFVIAAREFQKARSESGPEAKEKGPAINVVSGIAASLSFTERAAFYVSFADALERQVEPRAAYLYEEMIHRESPEFRRTLFDYARLSLGRGAEGARGIVGMLCQEALDGLNPSIPPRQALEALVESVFRVRGLTTPAGARDDLYNGRVKGILLRNLARPERAYPMLEALCLLEKRGLLELRGAGDTARCREALQSVCSYGNSSQIEQVMRGMAVSGNLAMMCAAKDCVVHGDISNVPAALAHKTIGIIASVVSCKGAESSQQLEDQLAMVKMLAGSVFSPRVSHRNVVEILSAAGSYDSGWSNFHFGPEILKDEPVFARRVAYIASGELGSQAEPLREQLRELLRDALLAPGVSRQVAQAVSRGTIMSSVGDDILSIREALFSGGERAFSWVKGVLR